MPTLKHLLEELQGLNVDPKEVKLSGQLYDEMVADAEESSEEQEE